MLSVNMSIFHNNIHQNLNENNMLDLNNPSEINNSRDSALNQANNIEECILNDRSMISQ